MDLESGKLVLDSVKLEDNVIKERPNTLLDSQKNTRTKKISKSYAKDDGVAVTVNVTLPTPVLLKSNFSIAQVAYPFKNSTDGKIEQFVHTPTTPGSDPRHPRANSLNSSPVSLSGKKPQLRRLRFSSKQFDLSNLTGLALSQKSLDSDSSEKSTTIRYRSSMQSPNGNCGPFNKRLEHVKIMRKRPSLKDLITKSRDSDDSLIIQSTSALLEKPQYKPIHGNSSKTTLASIDSHSLKLFENLLDKGLEARRQSLRYFGAKPTSLAPVNSPLVEKEIPENTLLPKAKFAYAIRMVRFMVRLFINLKFYARNKSGNQQSIQQLNYYSMETEFTTQKLVFSKGNFAASNVLCVPLCLRTMLCLPPHKRHSKDVSRMAMLLRSYYSFKDNMEKNKLEEICRFSTYARYEKQRIIIRSGHRSVFTYLLLSGSVFVNIEERNKLNGKKFIRTATVLKKGSLFGEIGVIHNIPRTATIVTREHVECLVIDPDACLRIFPEAISKEFQRRLEHMMLSDLFCGLPEQTLNNLCLVSKLLQYSYGVIVDKDTLTSEFIYMVIKGRLEVMYRLHVRPPGKTPSRNNDITTLSELLQHPPDHAFLPPLPAPSPPLLCDADCVAALRKEQGVLLSMDSIFPHQCCDLQSLAKSTRTLPLILVSRGCEVIRIPKLHLQTIPSPAQIRSIMDKARSIPGYGCYPANDVLTQLYLEHHQWASFRKLILQDILNSKDCFQSIPVPREGKKIKKHTDKDDGVLENAEKIFQKCLAYEEPLCDFDKHKHKGPCLRDWMNKSFKTKTLDNRRFSHAQPSQM